MRGGDWGRFEFSFVFFLVVFYFFFSLLSSVTSAGFTLESNNLTASAVDSLVQIYALRSLEGKRTGKLYEVDLPPDLAGVSATVLRTRSGIFWREGSDSSFVFQIPAGVIPVPFVRRIAIVFENFGNFSSELFAVENHSLVAPVVGILAFDQWNPRSTAEVSDVGLIATGRSIIVRFPLVDLPPGVNSTALRCVEFGRNGSSTLSDAELLPSANVCRAMGSGHFAIVAPSVPLEPPRQEKRKGFSKRWAVVAGGVVLVATMCFAAVCLLRVMMMIKKKNLVEMEDQAEREEALEFTWVGDSKMPTASMVRTSPVLENRISL